MEQFHGAPSKFPWFLRNDTFVDKKGDTWDSTTYCNSIASSDKNNQVKIDLEFQFRCLLSEETLKEVGFDFERFRTIGFSDCSTFEQKVKISMNAPLENLEKVTKMLVKGIFQKEFLNFSLEKKRDFIGEGIKKFQFSGFQDREQV